jgi:hypothetical protein
LDALLDGEVTLEAYKVCNSAAFVAQWDDVQFDLVRAFVLCVIDYTFAYCSPFAKCLADGSRYLPACFRALQKSEIETIYVGPRVAGNTLECVVDVDNMWPRVF